MTPLLEPATAHVDSAADRNALTLAPCFPVPDLRAIPRQDRAARLWSHMRECWRLGMPLRVETYLESPSFPKNDEELILDLVYGEFALREEHGERPTLDEYARRFPALADRLARQFALHQRMGSPPSDLRPTREATPACVAMGAGEVPGQVGKYRLLSLLGEGGQASVYRAYHPGLDKDVVIKLSHDCLPDGEAARDRLRTEGQALAELDHPNLARVLDLDVFQGRPFLVMEFVQGRSLVQAAREMPIAPRQAASLVAQVARAVGHAHRRGIIHRDIKPENILIDDAGRPRLIDFGLARVSRGWDQGTRPEDVCGTIAFMAPEQALGDTEHVGPCTDIFGLGGVLYFLLTGCVLFDVPSPLEGLRRSARGEWDPLPLRASDIPRRLRHACERALATDPRDRPASADALAAELESIARPSLLRPALLLGVLLAGLMLTLVWITSSVQRSGDEKNGVVLSEAPQPTLRVRVWEDGRYHDLLHRLPMQTGDEMRIEANRPSGWYVTLFWLDTTGELHKLQEVPAQSEATTLHYPPKGSEAVPLTGPEGTELIFLCASRSRPVETEEVRASLPRPIPWPVLPAFSVVRLGTDGVKVEQSGRGPGVPRRRPDPEGEVLQRLDELRLRLRQSYEALAGVAFAHL